MKNSPLCANRSVKLQVEAAAVAALLILVSCSALEPRRDPASEDNSPSSWTALVELKDLSDRFPGTHEVPRPADGWWVTPIHANLLANGKVLITGWGREKEKYCADHQGRHNGTTFILDPADLETTHPKILPITPIDENPEEPGDVLYCTGHAPLRDGRILLTGGARYKNLDVAATQNEFGLPYSRLYIPTKEAIARPSFHNPKGPTPTAKQIMAGDNYDAGSMWYPTNTRLPKGKILVAGGWAKWADVLRPDKFDFLNKSLSIFDPQVFDAGGYPWSVLVHHEVAGDELAIDTFDYVHTFLLPKSVKVKGHERQVALFGGGKTARFAFLSLDPKVPEKERLATQPGGNRPGVNMSDDSSASLLITGEIMIVGGGLGGKQESQRIDVYNPYSDSWYSINTGITRRRPSTVLLPDGNVLIVNGENKDWDPPDNVGDRRIPILFDPRTRDLKYLPPWPDDPRDRGYHSIALLLSDGRVLIGGGRTRTVTNNVEEYRIGCERPDIRIFTPPYLDPALGSRPRIEMETETPLHLKVGGPQVHIKVSSTPEGLKSVSLMALGAQTHAFDQNQRYVPLAFATNTDGDIALTPPHDEWEAPAGLYNLYVIGKNGMPSRSIPVVLDE